IRVFFQDKILYTFFKKCPFFILLLFETDAIINITEPMAKIKLGKLSIFGSCDCIYDRKSF
ncbi:MAG: hypothetical protein IJY93_09745, partial [Clostridia bacterium]|nr:hypothetical protein [Clostridia bacterium]